MGGREGHGIARATLSRRRQLLAAVGAGAPLLAACGAPGAGNEPPAPDVKGTTVEYLSLAMPTAPEEAVRLQVLANFSQQNPHGITVTAVQSAGQAGAREGQISGASMAQVVAALAASTPPDLVNTMNFNMAELYARGGTVDVDAELKGSADWKRARASVYPHILSGLSWQGKLFAVPTHSSFFLMYYNGELLKRAGLPVPPRAWTWGAFEEYLAKAGRPPDVWGYDDGWTYARTGMMFINNGARFTTADGARFLLNAPEVRETLEFQLRLARGSLMRPHDGSRSGGYAELLQQGRMVFQHAVPARVPVFRKDGLDFGTIFYPLGPRNTARTSFSHGTTYGYTVFRNGGPKRVQAALLAALQAATPESGLLFARDSGTPPSYRSVVEAPAFQAEVRKDAASWPFYEALPNFVPYPAFATFAEARAAVDEELGRIWAGQTSLNTGLDEAQRRAQQLLGQALQGAG